MQTDTILRRIEMLPALSRAGKRINGLHRLMRSPYLYELAYDKVSRNKGAMTPGIDGKTFDGMSLEKLADLARRVAEGSYRPRPVRRVYIPKSNGKLRPLGIPTVEDRLVQEVVRTILEAIYEPVFSEHSHGFRFGRSCHTALEEIRHTWTGAKWLIEVDVRGFFDNIDHDIMLKLIAKRIDDPKFVGLCIGDMLRAGWMEDWKFERTYSGTPQAGPRLHADSPPPVGTPLYSMREAEAFLGLMAVLKGLLLFLFAHFFEQALGVVKFHDVALPLLRKILCLLLPLFPMAVRSGLCEGPKRLKLGRLFEGQIVGFSRLAVG